MNEYGLQLYSVRDCAKENLLDTIREMARLGYKGMEFAGFFDQSAKDVKAVMDEAGVSAWGTHTGAPELEDDKIEKTIAYHKAIGCNRLIIPGADLSTLEKLEAFAALVKKAEKKLNENGILLAYHNHSHEFYPNEDGVVIYDWLLENTALRLEVDTYWAFNAGKDPIALLTKLGDRVISLHIKDGLEEGKGMPLGMGIAPVKAVHDFGLAHHIPLVVESETQTPDGPTEARICIEYLRKLDAE